jgi:hypothetical protein
MAYPLGEIAAVGVVEWQTLGAAGVRGSQESRPHVRCELGISETNI